MDPSVFTFTTGSHYTSFELVAFQNSGFAEYYVDFGTMSVERFEMMVGAALNHVPHLSLYMHHTSGEFVGFARTAIRGRRAWLGGLALVPAWRGKRLAPVLLRKYLELLQEQSNVKVLQLECFHVNTGALKLYKSVGFETNFSMQDYVIDEVESSSLALPNNCRFHSASQVDMNLPWLQYRTTYSWQREMSTVLAIESTQFEVRDSNDEHTLVAVVAEKREDHIRIVAIAYKEKVEAELLDMVIRKAAVAGDKSQAKIVLEPAHSDAIVLLEHVAKRQTGLEEQHLILDFERGTS